MELPNIHRALHGLIWKTLLLEWATVYAEILRLVFIVAVYHLVI